MTLVNIDLRNQGYETGSDDRVVFYSLLVREGDFGTISTAPVEVPLVDGKATVNLAPGPVGVQIIAGQVADTRVKIGEVPSSGPTTLGAVMMVTPAYTPALQKMMIAAIERAKEVAVGQIDAEAALAVDEEIGEFKSKAEQALTKSTAAESKSDTALSKSTTAESFAGNAVSRVEALEVMGGLAPGEPADGQTANLIEQQDTLTRNAVGSAAISAAGSVSIVDYGAKVSPFDSTSAFQSAIADAAVRGMAVFVPKGTWMVQPNSIELGDGQIMHGAGASYSTIISGGGGEGSGVILNDGCEIFGLYVREFGEGVTSRGYWVKCHDMKLSYNVVGYRAESKSYICKLYDNDITFNRAIGVMVGSESYQFDIHHNIIDNNHGIGVLLHATSGGVIVSDNTIEGNRDYTTGMGCGIYVSGNNMSRLTITGNWFEANGNTENSTDVCFAQRPTSGYRHIHDSIVSDLIPDTYSDIDFNVSGYGVVNVSDNAFYFTPNGLLLGLAGMSSTTVRDNAFKGRLDVWNRHILLGTAAFLAEHTQIEIANNGYNNTDNASGINPQVETGIGGSIVHTEMSPLPIPTEKVTYNGKPLFEKRMAFREFKSLIGFTAIKAYYGDGPSARPATRVAKVDEGISGTTAVLDNDWIGVTGLPGELFPYAGQKLIVLTEPGTMLLLQMEDTWRPYASPKYGKFTVIDLPQSGANDEMVTGRLIINAGGTVYGWAVVPPEKEHLLNKFTEVTISDWITERLPESLPES